MQSAVSAMHLDISIDDLNDWIEIDSNEPISEVITDQDIIDAVTYKNCSEQDDDDDIENDVVMKDDVPDVSEVISHLTKVISWMERQDDSDSVHLLHLASVKQYAEMKRNASVRQTALTDFFKTV